MLQIKAPLQRRSPACRQVPRSRGNMNMDKDAAAALGTICIKDGGGITEA